MSLRRMMMAGGGGVPGGIKSGLLHYWELEESSGNRADSHGSLSLSPSGSVGRESAKIGFGSSATTSSYLRNAASPDLSATDFTIAGVFATLQSNYGIVSRNGSSAASQRQFLVTLEGGVLFFAVSTSGTSNAASVSAGSGLSSGALHDFIAWRDRADNKIWLQLNGGTPVSATFSGSSNLYNAVDPGITLHGIGTGTYVGGGVCDQIGIWNRMLTSTERTALRNGGTWRSYADLAGI